MKKKAKLIATLSSLGLALAMMVFAVYAATSVTFKVTTNVSFEATKHVQATITARDSGATNVELTKNSTYSYPAEVGADQEIDVNPNGQTTGEIEDVKFKSAELTATNKYYGYQITITNNDDENALPISIITPEKQGTGYKITWDNNTATSIAKKEIGKTDNVLVITCIIEVTDLAGNKVIINNADLGLDIMLGEEGESVDPVIIPNEALTVTPIDATTAKLTYIDETKLSGVSTYSATPRTYSSEEVYKIPETAVHTDGKEYTIVTIGDGRNSVLKSSSIINKLIIPNSVTTIGNYAFRSCESLSSIEIPDSVTEIGYLAFEYCYRLAEVINKSTLNITAGSSDYGYVGCYAAVVHNGEESLIYTESGVNYIDYNNKVYAIAPTNPNCTNVTIKEETTDIRLYAFYYCKSLTSIEFSENSKLSTIGDYAFEYCTSLISIEIPDNVTTIGKSAFRECYSLQSAVISENSKLSTIGDSAFKYCTSLISIEIPDNVTTIGESAFYGCESLQSVILPENPQLTIINPNTFHSCVSLSSIKIPSGVTTIGRMSFYHCDILQSIEIPASVTTIGDSAFYYCDKLAEIINKSSLNITAGSTSYGYIGENALVVHKGDKKTYTENGVNYINYNNKVYVTGQTNQKCTSLTIKAEATDIRPYAFYSCESLQSIEFTGNSKLTTIGEHAFYSCESLQSIEIPASVTTIGDYAFYGCDSLTAIEIPASVTTIKKYAFGGCYSLQSVVISRNSKLTTIGSSAFNYCYKLAEVINKSTLNITAGSTSYGYIGYFAAVVHSGDKSLIYTENGVNYIDYNKKVYAIGPTNSNCTNITLKSETTDIKSYAFYRCDSLTAIEIPDNVTTIGKSAFYECRSLQSAVISENSKLSTIGDSAFYSCQSLTSIEIPAKVTSIESSAFNNCYGLAEVINKSTLNIAAGSSGYGYVGYYAVVVHNGDESLLEIVDGVYYYTDTKNDDDSTNDKVYAIGPTDLNCTNITIKEGTTDIRSRAFRNCYSLQSVVIPDSVTTIGDFAFEGCTTLTTIVIPASVTTIGDSAFEDCYDLTIYCEVSSKPSGWSYSWDYLDDEGDHWPLWAGEWRYDDEGNPVPNI